MRIWIGRWVMGVAILHTLFALLLLNRSLLVVLERGVFDAVGNDVKIGVAVWFVLFGAVLFILGLALSALEKAMAGALPASLGWSLFALAVIGVVLMPASGFWLAFPPAVAILWRARSTPPRGKR